MIKRHLLLANLLVFTGCLHQGVPRPNSDFRRGNVISGRSSPYTDIPQARVRCTSRLPSGTNSRDLAPEDRGPIHDNEISCVLGL